MCERSTSSTFATCTCIMSGIGWKRWFILFVGLWENLIFSGSILGWSALNYMLKQEGIFVDLCHDEYSSSASPYPYRNYSIESGVSGQLEKLPLLSSYINYSVLPSIGPSADLEADAVNLPEALPLLSLPSSTTTQPSAQQSSTFPPANSSLSSQQVMIQHHKVGNHFSDHLSLSHSPAIIKAAQRM